MASWIPDLLETWHIHNRNHQYLLTTVDAAPLSDTAGARGRNVGEQFAHIHNGRLMWPKTAQTELPEGLSKIEKEATTNNPLLLESLQQSGTAIAKMLEEELHCGRIKGFKPHPAAFPGYLISPESHHRGQILLTLKQSGHPVDKKVSYGIWEWGSR